MEVIKIWRNIKNVRYFLKNQPLCLMTTPKSGFRAEVILMSLNLIVKFRTHSNSDLITNRSNNIVVIGKGLIGPDFNQNDQNHMLMSSLDCHFYC